MARRLACAAFIAGTTIAACGSTHVAGPPPAVASAPPPSARAETEPPAPRETPADAGRAPGEYDVNHVLATGQSLAIGVGGRPPLTFEQPFSNLMFPTGVIAGSEGLDAFVPLVEGDTIPGTTAATETMSSAFANLASNEGRHRILVSIHGAGAFPYFKLKKGTRPYERGMAQVVAARDLAARDGKTYAVRAVTVVHGESDHSDKTAPATYAADLAEWQADYEADIEALTGQSEPVPMFQTQMSSWTRMMKGTATSGIAMAQLSASVASGGKIVMVGPKYHLPYAKDGVHLSNEGYRHMGEDYAKAYRRVVVEHGTWEPLRPVEVARDGAVITVRFVVPVPPLVIDTTRVVDPGHYGFEYTDASEVRPEGGRHPEGARKARSPTITKVELTGPDTVTITLSEAPTADDKHLRYAFTGTPGMRSGPETGARGNLRDSDATPSRHGYALYNWCVHFDEPVP